MSDSYKDDCFISCFKNEKHSRKMNGKARDKIKRDSKRYSSEVEKDYIDNIGNGEEEFTCLNETELIATLDLLNFTATEADDDNEQLLKQLKEARKKNTKIITDLDIDTSYYSITNFNQLNRDIKLFLKDEEEELFEIGPVPAIVRKFVHCHAQLYRIKSFAVGKGEDRRVVFQKLENSGLALNTRELDKIIEKGNKAITWCSKDNFGKNKGKGSSGGQNGSTKPVPGSIVGQNSSPIQDDNVGNQMLQKMGWSPGTGLGRESSGITNPIAAVVKTKRAGLI